MSFTEMTFDDLTVLEQFRNQRLRSFLLKVYRLVPFAAIATER